MLEHYRPIKESRACQIAGVHGYGWPERLWPIRTLKRQSDSTARSSGGSPKFPPDVLMQISGDLGNKGYLRELTELCRPHFMSRVHGLQVGNNLLKAYVDLKDIASARLILCWNNCMPVKGPTGKRTLGVLGAAN